MKCPVSDCDGRYVSVLGLFWFGIDTSGRCWGRFVSNKNMATIKKAMQ